MYSSLGSGKLKDVGFETCSVNSADMTASPPKLARSEFLTGTTTLEACSTENGFRPIYVRPIYPNTSEKQSLKVYRSTPPVTEIDKYFMSEEEIGNKMYVKSPPKPTRLVKLVHASIRHGISAASAMTKVTARSTGNPKSTRGCKVVKAGKKRKTNQLTRKSPGKPTQGGSTKSPGRSAKSPGRTAKSPGRTAKSPGRSAKSPGRSMKSPGKLAKSPGRSPKSPGRSTKSPVKSAKSPGRSAKSPGRSPKSPHRSTKSSGRSAKSAGRSPKSPGISPKSPGRSPKSPGRSPKSPGRSGKAAKSPGKSNKSSSRLAISPKTANKSLGKSAKSPGWSAKSPGSSAQSPGRLGKSPGKSARSPERPSKSTSKLTTSPSKESTSSSKAVMLPSREVRSKAAIKIKLAKARNRPKGSLGKSGRVVTVQSASAGIRHKPIGNPKGQVSSPAKTRGKALSGFYRDLLLGKSCEKPSAKSTPKRGVEKKIRATHGKSTPKKGVTVTKKGTCCSSSEDSATSSATQALELYTETSSGYKISISPKSMLTLEAEKKSPRINVEKLKLTASQRVQVFVNAEEFPAGKRHLEVSDDEPVKKVAKLEPVKESLKKSLTKTEIKEKKPHLPIKKGKKGKPLQVKLDFKTQRSRNEEAENIKANAGSKSGERPKEIVKSVGDKPEIPELMSKEFLAIKESLRLRAQSGGFLNMAKFSDAIHSKRKIYVPSIAELTRKPQENSSRSQDFRHKPVTCLDCGHIVPNRSALVNHKKLCLNVGQTFVFACFECQKSFRTRSQLLEHKRANHAENVVMDVTGTTIKAYVGKDDAKQMIEICMCPVCHKVCMSKEELKKHLVSDHEEKGIASPQKQSLGSLGKGQPSVQVKEVVEQSLGPSRQGTMLSSKPLPRVTSPTAKPGKPAPQGAKNVGITKVDSNVASKSLHVSICKECHMLFINREHFEKHCNELHGNKSITTPQCVEERKRKSKAVKKVRASKVEALCKCDDCNITFSKQKDLNKHLVVHHLIRCEECNEAFFNNQQVAEHRRKCHDLKCHICQIVFKNEDGLRKHVNSHKNQVPPSSPVKKEMVFPFNCDICKCAFKKKFDLKDHIVHTHKKEFIRFLCLECGLDFKTRTDLDKHRSIGHDPSVLKAKLDAARKLELARGAEAAKKIAAARKADAEKKKENALVKKAKTLENVGNIFEKFSPPKDVTPTAKSKQPEKAVKTFDVRGAQVRFLCMECNETFRTRELLHSHRTEGKCSEEDETNTRGKPYFCTVCYKSFSRREELTFHQKKIHMDVLSCEFCQTWCGSRDVLKAHIDKNHCQPGDGSQPEKEPARKRVGQSHRARQSQQKVMHSVKESVTSMPASPENAMPQTPDAASGSKSSLLKSSLTQSFQVSKDELHKLLYGGQSHLREFLTKKGQEKSGSCLASDRSLEVQANAKQVKEPGTESVHSKPQRSAAIKTAVAAPRSKVHPEAQQQNSKEEVPVTISTVGNKQYKVKINSNPDGSNIHIELERVVSGHGDVQHEAQTLSNVIASLLQSGLTISEPVKSEHQSLEKAVEVLQHATSEVGTQVAGPTHLHKSSHKRAATVVTDKEAPTAKVAYVTRAVNKSLLVEGRPRTRTRGAERLTTQRCQAATKKVVPKRSAASYKQIHKKTLSPPLKRPSNAASTGSPPSKRSRASIVQRKPQVGPAKRRSSTSQSANLALRKTAIKTGTPLKKASSAAAVRSDMSPAAAVRTGTSPTAAVRSGTSPTAAIRPGTSSAAAPKQPMELVSASAGLKPGASPRRTPPAAVIRPGTPPSMASPGTSAKPSTASSKASPRPLPRVQESEDSPLKFRCGKCVTTFYSHVEWKSHTCVELPKLPERRSVRIPKKTWKVKEAGNLWKLKNVEEEPNPLDLDDHVEWLVAEYDDEDE